MLYILIKKRHIKGEKDIVPNEFWRISQKIKPFTEYQSLLRSISTKWTS